MNPPTDITRHRAAKRRYVTENLRGVPYRIWVDLLARQFPRCLAHPLAAMFWCRLRLRRDVPQSAFAAPRSVNDSGSVRITHGQLPPQVAAKIARRIEELSDLNAQAVGIERIETLGPKEMIEAAYVIESSDHRPNRFDVWVIWSSIRQADGASHEISHEVVVEINSVLDDGRTAMTTLISEVAALMGRWVKLESVQVHHRSQKTSLARAIQTHRKRFAARSVSHPIAEAETVIKRVNLQRFEECLQNRHVRILTADEVDRLTLDSMGDEPAHPFSRPR